MDRNVTALAQCPVCLQEFDKLMVSNYCGHLVCKTCFRSLKNNSLFFCPVCRRIIHKPTVVYVFKCFKCKQHIGRELVHLKCGHVYCAECLSVLPHVENKYFLCKQCCSFTQARPLFV
jgi:hypothetical protein